MDIRQILECRYPEHGFDALGVAQYRVLDECGERLERWVGAQQHGNMEYMRRSLDIRHNLEFVMPGVRSVVVTLTNYKPSVKSRDGVPQVASFAWRPDYHYVIRGRLEGLLRDIQAQFPEVRGRAVVDSAPTFDRRWAQLAGLGYVGRSSMLINPQLGSYTLIGLLLLNVELPAYNEPLLEDLCGACRRCVEVCPGGAIMEDRTIDARRCLSYQTIELRTAAEIQLGTHLFGCEECLRVCPHNAHAKACDWNNNPIELTADQWRAMSRSEFKQQFGNTPLSRAGLPKIISNLDFLDH